MYYTKFDSKICEMILVGDDNGLNQLRLNTDESKSSFNISDKWIYNNEFFSDTINQINEYINGERKIFNIKLNIIGTDFQKKVWYSLCEIPYGEVKSYKDIAILISNPKAFRAVGMANSKNPLPIIIPCHRVIESNGKLGGFSSGLSIKKKLLNIELEFSIID